MLKGDFFHSIQVYHYVKSRDSKPFLECFFRAKKDDGFLVMVYPLIYSTHPFRVQIWSAWTFLSVTTGVTRGPSKWPERTGFHWRFFSPQKLRVQLCKAYSWWLAVAGDQGSSPGADSQALRRRPKWYFWPLAGGLCLVLKREKSRRPMKVGERVYLGVGFEYFILKPHLGKWSKLTKQNFTWVQTTTYLLFEFFSLL